MNLTVKNKREFISNFLGSISTLNDTCVLKIENDVLVTTLMSSDTTLALYAETPVKCDGSKNLNIPDLKKFMRVLDSVNIADDGDINFNITNNSIKFSNETHRFTYHLLEDGIVKSPPINMKRINEIVFDTGFQISEIDLSNLLKGGSFATETNKLYIFCEGNKVHAELGDRSRHNSDNFQCILSKEYTGNALSKPIPINFETFRLINFNKCKEFTVNVNSKLGVLKISLTKGNTKLIYIVSALIN